MSVSEQAAQTEERAAPTGWRLPPRLLHGLLLGLVLVLAAETLRVTVGTNFHVVAPGHCYRCAQPSPAGLQALVPELGIRTVINLRGRNEAEDWYQEEIEAADQLKVALVPIGLSAYTLPSPEDLRTLIDALETSPEPILLHCYSGSDRSGLASAAYLLLKTDTSLDAARNQISLRFGHNPWGKATCPRQLLNAYARWLETQECSHSSARFAHWARNDYRPDLAE